MADGGMSFITGLAAGAVAAGFSGFAGAGLEGFSAAVGFASSSAMMRRIDAKISSIEGSWTFAGCVISDSTSSTPSYAFYTKQDRICRFRICRPGFPSHQPTCPQIKRRSMARAGFSPLPGHQSAAP
jgi:hypothetical protein